MTENHNSRPFRPPGHRGVETTLLAIPKCGHWKDVESAIKKFICECIDCMSTSAGIVPRPYGHALCAEKQNEAMDFDFCYIWKSISEHRNVSILNDYLPDLCSYCNVQRNLTKSYKKTTHLTYKLWYGEYIALGSGHPLQKHFVENCQRVPIL